MSSLKDLASLIMIPSLYKDGRLDTVKPLGNSIIHPDATGNNDGTDGTTPAEGNFTFSRGSNLAATRVDVNGLIEKGRENLLLQSNQFDTTWLQTNTTLTSGQSGYNGNDAWKVASASGGQTGMQQNISFSNIHTFSIYAKAGSVDFLKLFVVQSGTNRNCVIDLSDGSIASEVKANSSPEASVTSLANGWYRIEMPTNANSATFVRIRPHLSVSDENLSVGDFIYIQDAQLEAGLVATDYIETGASTAQAGILEDMPRLDYSGSCPALLLEPQRTNQITHSEYFNGPNWINVDVTATENVAVSPEGVQNATRLNFTGTNIKRFEQNTSNAATACTASVFAKYIDHQYIMGRLDSTSGSSYAWFDIQSGEVVKVDGANGSVPDPIASVDDYGDGWYRLNITQNSTQANQEIFWYFVPDTNTSTASWTGSGSAYVYGATFEEGSYPTSYIPTYGSSVTRSDDSCLATSVSDVIGQTQGTMFIDFVFNGNPTSVDYSFMILGAIGSNYITIGGYNKSLYARVFNNTTQGTINALQMVVGTRYKIAIGYAENDVVMYVNGVNEGSDTSVSIPALSQIGFTRPSFVHSADVNQSVVFPTRLTNAELAALTTI